MLRVFFIFYFSFGVICSQQQNEIKNIYKRGLDAYVQKDTIKLKSNIKLLKAVFVAKKDSSVLAKYYHYKALMNKLQYNFDSAFFNYNISKDISKNLKDSLETGRRLLSISILQKNTKDFLGSEITSIEALNYLEPINSFKYLERTYNNLGIVSEELNQDEEAIKYYNKALLINKKLSNTRSFLYTINNLGFLFQQQNKHNEAIEFFNKGLKVDGVEYKFPTHYALLLENFTYSKLKLGESKNAIKSFKKVIQIRKKEKDYRNLSITHNLLSKYYYYFTDDIIKAKHHANKGLRYGKQTQNNKQCLVALKMLSNLSSGNQSKAYLEEYIILNDSLFQQERQLKNQFAKIRYETDKKEKENEALKIENEKTLAEAESQKQRATISLLISAVSIMFLLSGASFFRFRRKKLLFLAQLQKIEAREEERRQIAKSLHDEVAGDLGLLHRKLEKSQLVEEAQKLELVKDNVRNLSHQLSSVSFEEVPFRDQILNLVSDYFSPQFIIKVNGLKEIDWSEANKSIKRMLYLSLRECIQNCQKYAEASKMTISFSTYKKTVFLDVVDNGKGFDTTTQKKGIGLLNLQERVQELNGTLTIESEVGKGTHIIIQTPLNA